MKKFLALAACAMAIAIPPAWADEPASSCQVTMTVSDYSDSSVKADKITADVSLADGIYTIDNFLGTGQPLCFTLPENPTVSAWNDMGFVGDNLDEAYEGFLDIWNPEDEDEILQFTLTNFNGEDLTLSWPFIYTDTSKAWYREEEGKKPWNISLTVGAYNSEDEECWLDVSFWMPELVEPSDPGDDPGDDPAEPTIIDFESMLMGSFPSNEEPIDLNEYELGAGFLNIAFGGELFLVEGAATPVTIALNGQVVASKALKEEDIVIMGNEAGGFADDDVDPGMTAGLGYSVIELDFDMALTEAGDYTVSFPEGILKFADGNILGAGTVTYTIEAQEPPAYEGELDAWVSNYSTDTYYPYECDATVNEDGSVTVTNFMNGRIDVNFTFDITQLQKADDDADITSANGKTADFWLKDAEGNYPTYYLTSEEGDKISFQKAYIYLDGYSKVSRLDEAVYGYNTWVEFSTYSKVTDSDAQYLYVGFYMNLDYPETPEVVVVPETTGNTEAWIETPYTEGNSFYNYNMDVIYNEDGSITTTNFMYSGADVTLTFDAEALRDSKKGYVGFKSINGSTDKFPYLLNANGKYVTAYAYNENGTKDTIEYPFFYNSSSYCCIGLYSEEEAAEYGHNAYIDLIVQGFVGDDYSDYYEVYFDIDVTLPAKPVEFADAIMGSMPSNEEPIDLDEYPLGAGFLNIAFGGELALTENAAEAPVTISRNGEEVASLTLTDECLVVLGKDDAGQLAEDDVDPGMTADVVYTVVELDFGKTLTEAGEYTVSFPEGIMAYADGAILKAGTVSYTIEEKIPVYEGELEGYVSNYDKDIYYLPYQCDATVNEDGSVTVANFMNGGIDMTFTFDIDELKNNDDTTPITSANGKTAAFWIKDADGNYPTYRLTTEDGTKVSFQKAYLYFGKYTYVMRLDEAEYDGYNTWVEFCTYSNITEDESAYLYVGFYMNLDYTGAVQPEPTIVDFADAIMGSMPSNEEPIDLEEYPLGAGFLNIAIGGELKLAEGAEAPVTIAHNGEEVASITLTEENLVVIGNDDAGTLAEDDVDPGMTASVAYTVVELDFGKALTEAGEYTVTFPEALLAYADGNLLGAGTVTYTIDEPVVTPEPVVVEFKDAFMGSMPDNEEPIDLDENPLGAGFLNLVFQGELALNEGAEAPVAITFNGEEVASITLNEECVVVLGKDDAGGFAEGDDDVDPGMGVSAVTTVVELDFGKALTEAGEYSVTFPEALLAYADGNLLGAGTVTYTIDEPVVTPEPVVVEFKDAFMGSMPDNEEPIDLDENPLGAGFLNLVFQGELALNEGAEAPVAITFNGEEVASITLNEECVVVLGKDDAGGFAEGDDDVDPAMGVSAVTTVVELDFGKALTEAGEYTVTFPEALLAYADGNLLGAGTVTYTIDEPVVTPEPEVIEFNDVLMNSIPSNEEPIDLEENPLGAGYITVAFAGELAINEAVTAPVTIAYNGEAVAELFLSEEDVVVMGNDDAGLFDNEDDVDPGMTVGVVYTAVVLDFGKALTEAGEYTVTFPEAILTFADGNLLGAGTVTYTIEEKTPVVVVPETFGNTTAWIETPWSNGEYYGYNMDVTKNEPGDYTTTNFMYSGASVTVTFDVEALKDSKDGYVGFTSLNGSTEQYPYLKNAEGKYVNCYAYNVDGTMTTIETPYFYNWDDWSFVELYSEEEAEEYGHNAYLCFLIQGWNADGSSSDWYEVWFDIDVDLTETGIQSVTIGGDAEYYDLHGVRVANPDKGIYIMRQGNKTVKVAK